MYTFSPDICHEELLKSRKPLLAFNPDAAYDTWKPQVTEKFTELLGDVPEPVDLNVIVEKETDTPEYKEYRFVFDTEAFASVPCHLLVPKAGNAPYPLVICLQGHTSGMHNALGRPKFEGDENYLQEEQDFAIQAVQEGYAALTVEQRGFGERVCAREKYLWKKTTCEHPAMVALLMGRTLLRERAWDVSRAIDAVSIFPDLNLDRIGLVGQSGGGTATYYTACLEPRIKIAMPVTAVCSFERSIVMRRHCDCNYVPRMAKYFDMGEMACMIAPRPLIIVAGAQDTGFRVDGTEKVYKVIEEIYRKEGAPENCKLLIGSEGHRFYKDLSWGPFRKLFLQ